MLTRSSNGKDKHKDGEQALNSNGSKPCCHYPNLYCNFHKKASHSTKQCNTKKRAEAKGNSKSVNSTSSGFNALGSSSSHGASSDKKGKSSSLGMILSSTHPALAPSVSSS